MVNDTAGKCSDCTNVKDSEIFYLIKISFMEIDELIWRHNKEMAINALYDDEMCLVESYTRRREISDYRAK